MTAAYKRVAELLDRWQASIDLHTRYLELDDATYARMQDWPRHQRPTRWVVELARTRLQEMRLQLEARRDLGDETFAESLELMSFITNLLGSEHIDRFIPLAQGMATTAASGTVRRPRIKATDERTAARAAPDDQSTAVHKPPARAQAARPAAAQRPDAKMAATVVADAVRFLGWGREWPALAGLIARLADRPAEPEVWKILRAHRETIERRARSTRN